MNPIFIEYYSHTNCDCYKIDLPWTKYKRETVVLGPVSDGFEAALIVASGVMTRHLADATQEEPCER